MSQGAVMESYSFDCPVLQAQTTVALETFRRYSTSEPGGILQIIRRMHDCSGLSRCGIGNRDQMGRLLNHSWQDCAYYQTLPESGSK